MSADYRWYSSSSSTMRRGSIHSHISLIIRSFINIIGRYFFKKKKRIHKCLWRSNVSDLTQSYWGRFWDLSPTTYFHPNGIHKSLEIQCIGSYSVLLGKVLRSLPYYLFPSIPHFWSDMSQICHKFITVDIPVFLLFILL